MISRTIISKPSIISRSITMFDSITEFDTFCKISFDLLIKKQILFYFNLSFTNDTQKLGKNFELHLYFSKNQIKVEVVYSKQFNSYFVSIDKIKFSYSLLNFWFSYRNRNCKFKLGKYLIINVDAFIDFIANHLNQRINLIRKRI